MAWNWKPISKVVLYVVVYYFSATKDVLHLVHLGILTITYELYVTGKTLEINKFSYGKSSHKGRVNSTFSQLLQFYM